MLITVNEQYAIRLASSIYLSLPVNYLQPISHVNLNLSDLIYYYQILIFYFECKNNIDTLLNAI